MSLSSLSEEEIITGITVRGVRETRWHTGILQHNFLSLCVCVCVCVWDCSVDMWFVCVHMCMLLRCRVTRPLLDWQDKSHIIHPTLWPNATTHCHFIASAQTLPLTFTYAPLLSSLKKPLSLCSLFLHSQRGCLFSFFNDPFLESDLNCFHLCVYDLRTLKKKL